MDASFDPNEIPALDPPLGVKPNFINPYSSGGPTIVALAVLVGVATLAFFTRLLTKIFIVKEMRLTDYMICIGWAFFVALEGTTIAQIPVAAGRHQWDVSFAQAETFLQLLNYAEMCYGFCMLFIKFSILLQLQQIFSPRQKGSVYWLTVSLMILDTAFYIAAVTVVLAQCNPREKIWNPLISGTCINNNANIIATGAFNFVLDVLIFILPIYAIVHLQMPIKQKIGISAVFATGLLTCISSLLRLYYTVQITEAADETYEITYLMWTAALEGCTAILVACLPVFPRLYRFLRGERRGYPSRPTYERHALDSGSNARSRRPNTSLMGHAQFSDSQTGLKEPVATEVPLDGLDNRQQLMKEGSRRQRSEES